jgi:flagellin-like hook-associated protein FlgL
MANTNILSGAMQANLNSLSNTNALLAASQNRIATGKRVASATDDPVAYFQALSLDNRASDLSSRKDNMAMGVSTITAATNALTSMGKLIEQAKSLATQAKEASSQVTKITSGLDLSANTADVTGSALNNADTFTIQVGNASAKTITISTGDTVDDVVDAIEAADSSLTATYNTSTGKIEISAASGTVVTFADGVGTPLADSSLFTVGATTFGSTGSGSSIATLQANFKTLMDQIDQLRSDAIYKGINLLNGNNLTVNFNEDASSAITVSGVTYNHTGLGFTAKASVDWTTAGNIDTAISEADAALSSVRTQSSTFGTNLSVVNTRLDFTNSLITILQDGSNKLTAVDTAAESATILALQTRQQLGTQALVLANQAQQSVLSLFR